MPIRHGGRLASRASTWPRDHFCRSTMAPRWFWPTMWNEFLPISMPITAGGGLSFFVIGCSFFFVAPPPPPFSPGGGAGRPLPYLEEVADQSHLLTNPQHHVL